MASRTKPYRSNCEARRFLHKENGEVRKKTSATVRAFGQSIRQRSPRPQNRSRPGNSVAKPRTVKASPIEVDAPGVAEIDRCACPGHGGWHTAVLQIL